jgi:hypothetical protein
MSVLDLTAFLYFMVRFNQLSNPKLLLSQGLFKLDHRFLLGIDLIFQLLHQNFLRIKLQLHCFQISLCVLEVLLVFGNVFIKNGLFFMQVLHPCGYRMFFMLL